MKIASLLQFSINDFKTRYKGSRVGLFLVLSKPIITTLLYWFVNQIINKASDIHGVPYILWLISGLIPWFFATDALYGISTAPAEYSYLVKKVAFNSGAIPIFRLISCLFIHIFFILISFLVSFFYKIPLSIHSIQIFYYTFCLIMLVLSLGLVIYCLSALFGLTSKLLELSLDLLFWLTPIFWNISEASLEFKKLMLFNPFCYVIEGYRNVFVYKSSLTQISNIALIFWAQVILLFLLGCKWFKNIRSHLADL